MDAEGGCGRRPLSNYINVLKIKYKFSPLRQTNWFPSEVMNVVGHGYRWLRVIYKQSMFVSYQKIYIGSI